MSLHDLQLRFRELPGGARLVVLDRIEVIESASIDLRAFGKGHVEQRVPLVDEMTCIGMAMGTRIERSATGRSTWARLPGTIVVPAIRTGRGDPRTREPNAQPLPRVRVLAGLACPSMKAMIWPAMSLPVAFSMPSRPGEELTSMMTGP